MEKDAVAPKKDFMSKLNSFGVNMKSLKKFFTSEFLYLTSQSLNPSKVQAEEKLSVGKVGDYFKYPIIFTQSIFYGLSKNKHSFITLDEYVNGFLSFYSKSLMYKVLFIFKMFNINKDNYIQKLDVSIILNYTHIFFKKQNQDLLKTIINNFFDERSFYNLDGFINNIKKRNSDLFFVVLAILFESENFNEDVLRVFEDENVKCDFKDVPETVFDYADKDKIKDLSDLKRPTDEALQYLQINFGYDLSFLKNKEQDKPTDEGKNNSLDSTGEEIDNLDDDEDMLDLLNFETDIQEVKCLPGEKVFFDDNFVLPKGGSNHYNLNDGVFESALSFKLKSIKMDSNKSLGFWFDRKSALGSNSFLMGSFRHKSNCSVRKVDSYCGSPSVLSCRNNNPEEQTSNIFVDEIITQKKGLVKTLSIKLINGFLFVLKRATSNILTIGNSFVKTQVKKIIPTKHLYVKKIEEGVVINEMIYTKLTLLSTVKFPSEEFCFFFESRRHSSDFIKLLAQQTKYVSISSEYSFVKDIGKGGFCQVKLMRNNKTGDLFSVKKIKKKATILEEFEALNWEKDIVTFLSNFPNLTNIIKYHRIIESSEYLYIVMDYIATGSLGHYITKKKANLSSSLTKKIVEQMFSAIKELHSYGIIHRDLKLDNILLNIKGKGNFEIKLIDFGLSQVLTPYAKAKESYGTLHYCSPEILLRLPYDYRVDVWSAGIIAYYLEFNYMPFEIKGTENPQRVCNMVVMNHLIIPNKKYDDDKDKSIEMKAGELMKKVISNCLCKNITQRPTSEKIFSLLSTN